MTMARGRGVGTLDHLYIYTYIVIMIYYPPLVLPRDLCPPHSIGKLAL